MGSEATRSASLTCPACGRNGAADFSLALSRHPVFKVDKVTEGFEVKTPGHSISDTVFVCTGCGQRAKSHRLIA